MLRDDMSNHGGEMNEHAPPDRPAFTRVTVTTDPTIEWSAEDFERHEGRIAHLESTGQPDDRQIAEALKIVVNEKRAALYARQPRTPAIRPDARPRSSRAPRRSGAARLTASSSSSPPGSPGSEPSAGSPPGVTGADGFLGHRHLKAILNAFGGITAAILVDDDTEAIRMARLLVMVASELVAVLGEHYQPIDPDDWEMDS